MPGTISKGVLVRTVEIGRRCIISVSYTHLDVYKRQAYSILLDKNRKIKTYRRKGGETNLVIKFFLRLYTRAANHNLCRPTSTRPER